MLWTIHRDDLLCSMFAPTNSRYDLKFCMSTVEARTDDVDDGVN